MNRGFKMKKLQLFLTSIAISVFLFGCQKANIDTTEGKKVVKTESREVCYDNVKYAMFSSAKYAWGGIKMTPENIVQKCSPETRKIEGQEYCNDGVVYVRFSSAEYAWGGIKFDVNSNVVRCGINKEDLLRK